MYWDANNLYRGAMSFGWFQIEKKAILDLKEIHGKIRSRSKFEWSRDNIRIEKIILAPTLVKKIFLEVSALLAVRHAAILNNIREN